MSPAQQPSPEEPTRPVRRETDPTAAFPPEPENIDELLAESLKAQSEQDFTWKEPERRLRWWQRAEVQQSTAGPSSLTTTAAPSAAAESSGPKLGQLVFAAICLILALWTVMTVLFGVFLDPILLALGICTLAGLALVVSGLRPRPGRRI